MKCKAEFKLGYEVVVWEFEAPSGMAAMKLVTEKQKAINIPWRKIWRVGDGTDAED